MANDNWSAKDPSAALALVEQLQESGFFDQVRDLDGLIKKIAGDLDSLGSLTTQRVQETENLAAHVLAVEAILAAILKTHPIDGEAVQEAIREIMPETGEDSPGPAVQSVVNSLLRTSGK
jgi:hypothetical protein